MRALLFAVAVLFTACGPRQQPHCAQLEQCAPHCPGVSPYNDTLDDAHCQQELDSYASACQSAGSGNYACGSLVCAQCHEP